ncbi:MAG: Mut7-C RNAse domain-containing protein, partial [Bacteroidota bacterium]
KKEVENSLDTATKKYYTTFFMCNQCEKIYWKGSHYQQMTEFLSEIADFNT